ncbi:hypothetical protein PUN28_013494 [Cardiocondyla obscurior]|uniref:Transmembrane protein 192 n=1 Tax=Cardiocondyla obscurior TaxID=286306 RepID=A0AAW2F6N8_9HYME
MEEECFQPVLSSQEENNFQKLNTVWILLIPVSLLMSLQMYGLVYEILWLQYEIIYDTYFIFLYLHCAYWLSVMTIDHIVKAKHYNLRINGYLDFYQSTYQILRTPLFIASLWNVYYLLLAAVLHQTHKVDYEQYCRRSKWFTPLNFVYYPFLLEYLITFLAYVKYIKKVREFNRLRPPPDVTRDEWLSPFTQDSYSGMGEIGYRQRGRNLEELLEKQADFIRYLKAYNMKLNHKIELFAGKLRELGHETNL